MLTTTLPGFENLTQDSQQTFRALLGALSEPGKLSEIALEMSAPEGMNLACAAACLTLIDFETAVWLQPSFSGAVKDWLRFHTGCSFTENSAQADFAVVNDLRAVSLDQFGWGTAELPEDSTTLLVQVEDLFAGEQVCLRGPGILESRMVSPVVPDLFWQAWAQNHAAYPRGVDCFLLSHSTVMGLPRSAQASVQAAVQASAQVNIQAVREV